MVRFLIDNRRWLGTGLLLTFASSFGQTWFISLFAGQIKSAYGLSDGGWGGLYTLATLAAAALLLMRGSLADTMALWRLAPAVAVLFALAAATMALGIGQAGGGGIWVLGLAVFLLRFCGQGMFGHLAATAMARWFVATRGRALSIASLGYAAGDMILPVPTVFLIALIGPRAVWILVAAVLAVIIAPLLYTLFARDRSPLGLPVAEEGSPGLGGQHWRRADVLRHWLFFALAPFLFAPGFIGTAVFFNQVHIATVKGWTLAAMATAYPVFAAVVIASGLMAGWAVDRFGPSRLLPFLTLPMAVSMLMIGPVNGVGGWVVLLAIMAVTQGMTGTFWGALLPWAYGTRNLGAVRALTTSVMVVSTAIGPGVTGYFIDRGISFPDQGIVLAIWCLGLSVFGLWLRRRVVAEAARMAT